jgi:hypothetical protein
MLGVQFGLCVGGGVLARRVVACTTLGDGQVVGTLGAGTAGNLDCSTLGTRVMASIRSVMPGLSIRRKIFVEKTSNWTLNA